MKIVFVPQLFYMSLVFSVILSILLYIETNISVNKNKDNKFKNKPLIFFIYLFLIGYIIFSLSFRIWIFDIYISSKILISFILSFFMLLYYIYTNI